MQKFVKYYRVSTRSQGQSGLGIEAQQRDVQLYLDNYLNEEHEVIATYTEIDSGSKENRIELSKAIEFCKKYNATLIVIISPTSIAKKMPYGRRNTKLNNSYISYKSQIRFGIIFPPYHSIYSLNIVTNIVTIIVTIVLFTRIIIIIKGFDGG